MKTLKFAFEINEPLHQKQFNLYKIKKKNTFLAHCVSSSLHKATSNSAAALKLRDSPRDDYFANCIQTQTKVRIIQNNGWPTQRMAQLGPNSAETMLDGGG